jgi:uncharacterized protein YbjT (DUF2867 family)
VKLLILGGTGRTGRRLAALAVKQGHRVVVIARSPEKLAGLDVEIVPGTPYDRETVARALAGCDAVVNVLNVSRTSDNPWAPLSAPPDLISRGCANALQSMEASGVRRYVTLSTVGAGDSWKLLPLPLRLLVRYSNLRHAFDDHGAEEALLAVSRVDFTVARAPMLTDREGRTGVLVTRPGEKMRSSISRQAVAEFLLSILESGRYPREIVHVSGDGLA